MIAPRFLVLLLFMIPLFLTDVYGQKDPDCGGVNDPCVLANSTLAPCDGNVPPPSFEDTVYKISTSPVSMYPCLCTTEFYNALTRCATCLPGAVTVEPLDVASDACAKAGFTFDGPKTNEPSAKVPDDDAKVPAKDPAKDPAEDPAKDPAKTPKSPIDKDCGTSLDPCSSANSTLAPCKASVAPPSPEAISGQVPWQYTFNVNNTAFLTCACNMEFYTFLQKCATCFYRPGNNITVQPLDTFMAFCEDHGVGFTLNPKEPQTPTPSKQPQTPPKAPPTPPKVPSNSPKVPKDVDCNTAKDPCMAANSSLSACGRSLNRPPQSVLNGEASFTYIPENEETARCMCNDPFYDLLKRCVSCYQTPKSRVDIAPPSDYKKACDALGVTYGTSSPSSGSSMYSISLRDSISLGLCNLLSLILYNYHEFLI